MYSLTSDQRRRYDKNLILPEIGEAGQLRLMQSRVLVIGAGGLGAPVLLYLAAAGVGTLGIADDDRVELSNLQRQIIYETGDTEHFKSRSSAERIHELNPDVKTELHTLRLTEDNAASLIAPYDLIADCTDNFISRYAIADACLRLKKPLVTAALRGFQGHLSVFAPWLHTDQPCYRCFCPEPPGDCDGCTENGVLGAFAGAIGSLQALEILKLITGAGESLIGKLLILDGLSLTMRTSRILRDPGCQQH